MLTPETISIAAVCITVLGFSIQHFWVIAGLSNRIVKLETQVGLFWGTLERNMARFLISPHTPELDILLEQIAKGELPDEKYPKAIEMLKQEIVGEPEPARKMALGLLIVTLETRVLASAHLLENLKNDRSAGTK